MRNFLTRQPYSVTTMQCREGPLSIHEHRILLRIIERLQPRMVLDKTPEQLSQELQGASLSFRLREFVVGKGGSIGGYGRVRSALEGMTSRLVVFTRKGEAGEKVETLAPLLAAVHFSEQTGEVHLSISREVLGQMLSLSGGFTRYDLEASFSCRSVHEARLYQIVCQFRGKKQGEFFLPVSLLRRALSLQEKYGRVQEIFRCILRPVSVRLKRRVEEGTCDVWYEVKERCLDRLDGRRVGGWKIRLKSERGVSQRTEKEEKGDKQRTKKEREKEQRILKRLRSLNLGMVAQWLLKRASHAEIFDALYRLQIHKSDQNYISQVAIKGDKVRTDFKFLCRQLRLKEPYWASDLV